MKVTKTDRGFERIERDPRGSERTESNSRLVGQSSAVGNYPAIGNKIDSYSHPGTSYLWVGEHHHLNREEVAELVEHLNNWLETGSLEIQ